MRNVGTAKVFMLVLLGGLSFSKGEADLQNKWSKRNWIITSKASNGAKFPLGVRGGFTLALTSNRRHGPRIGSEEMVIRTSRSMTAVPRGGNFVNDKDKSQTDQNRHLTLVLSFVYLAKVFGATLPVVLLPVITSPFPNPSAYAAAIASVATLGGAFGKLVNGFVCQNLGGKKASSLYLLGMALCSFLFSTMTGNFGLVFGLMEFCASMQWTACLVVFSNHYEKYPDKMAAAVTSLSLASTGGIMLAKLVGTILLRQQLSWRTVQQVGSAMTLVGLFVIRHFVQDHPTGAAKQQKKFELSSIYNSLGNVFGSRLFWIAGAGHSVTYLVRQSDRILGTFYREASGLPESVCGGLTASVTFGLVLGLVTGRVFNGKSVAEKTKLLIKRYLGAVTSALVLALCANAKFISLAIHPAIKASIIALASGCMASSLSYQFYQLPPVVSATFGQDKSICLSFLDGLGFLMAAPIWAATSATVNNPNLGWQVAWTNLAALFGLGGIFMMRVIPPVLKKQEEDSI